MAFHLIGILDGVGLVILVRSEALAVVAYLSFQVLQFCSVRFRGRGRASGWLLRRSVLRYGCKADRKQ